MVLNTEAVTQRCFVKKVVLQVSENSEEKTLIESLKGEILAHRDPVNFEKFVRTHF